MGPRAADTLHAKVYREGRQVMVESAEANNVHNRGARRTRCVERGERSTMDSIIVVDAVQGSDECLRFLRCALAVTVDATPSSRRFSVPRWSNQKEGARDALAQNTWKAGQNEEWWNTESNRASARYEYEIKVGLCRGQKE